MSRTPFLAALMILTSAAAAPAQDGGINLMGGEALGTSFRIGEDIAALGADCGVAIRVEATEGAIENFVAVRDRRATQLGIVPGDVLEYYATYQTDDPEIRRVAQGMRIVLPLQSEAVHVLARREIADLAGLNGRRVGVGAARSGTGLTAQLILDIAEVAPAERLALGPAEALAALTAGEIDAFFFVSGTPAPLFEAAEIDPAAFHLLALDDPALRALYAPARIEAGTYAFQAEPLEVVAVRAQLVTYDFVPGRNAYQRAACEAVSDVAHLVVSRLEQLRETGHPGWRTVDLTALPAGWTVSDCALDGVAPDFAFTCRRPDGTTTNEGAAPTTTTEPNRLYLERICARIGC